MACLLFLAQDHQGGRGLSIEAATKAKREREALHNDGLHDGKCVLNEKRLTQIIVYIYIYIYIHIHCFELAFLHSKFV